jgi:curved DNA-binding protein CbpA
MNLNDALNILEITSLNNLTEELLKKKYHKLALLNHPDKNGNTIDSKQRFQQILEAYSVLKREISYLNETRDEYVEQDHSPSVFGYSTILNLFIDGLLKGKYNEFISNIVKDIASGCKEISIKLFEDMNKEQSLSIYNFVAKYKHVLRIDDKTLEKVREIIINKFNDMQIYILNPSLNDLFQNNVYKLDIDNKIYFVPLWHSELYFESDIIVKCNPELPENMEIDEENNLIVTERISFTYSLLTSGPRIIKLGGLSFELPIEQLYIRSFQTFTFKKQGISKISDNDIYNVDDKADIIVKIIFE